MSAQIKRVCVLLTVCMLLTVSAVLFACSPSGKQAAGGPGNKATTSTRQETAAVSDSEELQDSAEGPRTIPGIDQAYYASCDELNSYLTKKLKAFPEMSWVINCYEESSGFPSFAFIKIPCDKPLKADEFVRVVAGEFGLEQIFVNNGALAYSKYRYHNRGDDRARFELLADHEYVYYPSNNEVVYDEGWFNGSPLDGSIIPASLLRYSIRYNEQTHIGYLLIKDEPFPVDENDFQDSKQQIKHGTVTLDDFYFEIYKTYPKKNSIISFGDIAGGPKLQIGRNKVEHPVVDADYCPQVVVGKDIEPGVYLLLTGSGWVSRSFLTPVESGERAEIIYGAPSYIELKEGDIFSACGIELVPLKDVTDEDLLRISGHEGDIPTTRLNKVTADKGGIKPGKYLVKADQLPPTSLKVDRNLRNFYNDPKLFDAEESELPTVTSDTELELKEGDYISLIHGYLVRQDQ